MAEMNVLREGVRRSLPEIDEIEDQDLRMKVVEAWALSLSHSEFERIEDISPAGVPGRQIMTRGTQADHIRGVARIATAMVEELERLLGPIGVNRSLLLASALCHDVGKPFEFSQRNQARWQANPAAVGLPSVRHPVYGAYIALTVGLPEAVVHTAGGHAHEGDFITRSLENTIIHYADEAYWDILERAGLVRTEDTGGK